MKISRVLLALTCLVPLTGCDALHQAENGGRYAAKWTCSCVFVQQRSEASCAEDLMSGADRMPRSVDYAAKRVTAGVPMLSGAASYKEGEGCRLD